MRSSTANEPYTMRQARKDREYVKAGGKCPASYTSDAIEGPVFQVVARVAIFYQVVHPEIQTTRFLQRYPG